MWLLIPYEEEVVGDIGSSDRRGKLREAEACVYHVRSRGMYIGAWGEDLGSWQAFFLTG